MSSNFGRNILFLLAINLLVKPFYIFGIEVQVQNMIGPESYGQYFALYNFCFLFLVILDPGVHNYNSKWIAENHGKVTDHISKTIGSKLLLSLSFLCIVGLAGLIIGYPISYYKILGLIAINFLLASIYVFIKSHFPALGKYHYENFFSVLDKLLMILILGFQVYIIQKIDIYTFAYSIMTAYFISIFIATIVLRKHIKFSLKISFSELIKIVKSSFAFALIGLFMSLYNRMDGVMLERMMDDNGYQAGIYAAGYRILDASNMFALLFASILLPLFANLIAKNKSVLPVLKEASALMLLICMAIVSIGFFYATDIMQLLYTDFNPLYAANFSILIIGFFGVGMSYVFGTLLTANGKLWEFNVLLFIGILVNWILNYLLISKMQSLGASYATLITQMFILVGQLYLVSQYFKIRISLKMVFRVLLFVLVSLIVSYLIHTLPINWIIKMLITGIIIILASFLLGIIRWYAVISQLKSADSRE